VKLFLDANVLGSAAFSKEGRARAIFRLAERGACSLLSSRHAIGEARRNIQLKAPNASGALETRLHQVEVAPAADPRVVAWAAGLGLPPNDAPILAAAAGSGADLLVTGDRRHFGSLYGTSPGGVLVATPATALAMVLDELES